MGEIVTIPHELYQVTRNLGNQKDIEFYYVLKSIDSSGFIHKRDLLDKVSMRSKLSTPSVYRRVKNLIELEWVTKTKNGYRLCTYRQLFQELGYREFNYTRIRIREPLCVMKVSAGLEIQRRLMKQAHTAKVALERDAIYQRSFKNTRGGLLERLEQVVQDQIAYMVKRNQLSKETFEYQQASQSIERITYCNPDITMSHERLKDLLGLKSTSQVYVLLKEMEDCGMVNIRRDRRVLVASNISYFEFLRDYGDKFYRYHNRNSYKILPNKYFFNEY